MTYAGYKPNETASLGAITATGLDAITKINLEREKLDAARKVKQDALTYKAALEAQKEAKKEETELEKEKKATKEKLVKNEGKTPFTINLQANMGEVGVKHIDLDPSSQNALIAQTNTWHAMMSNMDAPVAKLAENKNPSMQSTWVFERTIGDFQKQTVSTIVEGKGNDAKFIFKNEKGETVSMDGLGSIKNNVSNTMPNLDEDYNKWYAQIGEQQKEVGRTSKLDVGAQNNFTAKKDEIKSLILSDRENLGNRAYLVSQKNGKTPIFYYEGDDKKELLAKSGVIESNAEFIKMVTNTNGETYAELTGPQKDAMKKDVDDELAIRVKKSEHTQPEHKTSFTYNQAKTEKTDDQTAKIYNGVLSNDPDYIEIFKDNARAAGGMINEDKAKLPVLRKDNSGKFDLVETDAFIYDNGVVKYLYQDGSGNIRQKVVDGRKLSKEKATMSLGTALKYTTAQNLGKISAVSTLNQ
jgi:hypothetical protein